MQNKKVLAKKPRRFLNVLKWIGIIIVGLLLVGFIYEQFSEFIDKKTLKAPGQMVQVGNHKMHIYCTGENKNGSPTVILEAGGGMAYTTWNLVQPEISKDTRVCSYDRSGLGFSEPTDDKRTNLDVVVELETLLKNSNITGPYVVVGHSVGGFYARLFVKRNINEVKGLLEIDPSVEEMKDVYDDLSQVPVSARIMDEIYDLAFRIGIPRLIATISPKTVGITGTKEEISFIATMYKDKNKFGDAYGMFEDVDLIKSSVGFKDLPVIVLSADQSYKMNIDLYGDKFKTSHEDLAKKLSNNSKHIMVNNSSHIIQQDQPQVVIDQIKSLLK